MLKPTMTLEQYHSLSHEELTFLHIVINELEPKLLPYNLDHNLFVTIKHNFLMNRLLATEKFVSIEYRNFYKQLVEKLQK